jgi:hypothetical protein
MILMLAAAGCAAGVFGDVLERWEFNDPVTDNLWQADNSGTLGSAWSWGDPAKWQFDGVGNLRVPGGPGNDWKNTSAYGTPLTSAETYSFEMKVSSWTMDAAMAGSALKYRMVNNYGGGEKYMAEIRFQMKSDGTGAEALFVSGNTNYRTYDIGGLSGGPVTLRIDFDMDDATAEYFIDDVSQATLSTDPALMSAGIEQIKMSREGGWASAGTALYVDELSLSVIPEPAAASLFSAVGLGLLAIRRVYAGR